MAAPASPCVVVKPEPIDASLPLLPFAHPSNISSSPHTSSHSSHSPPTSQPNVKVKLEDRGSPKAYESSTATVEGQAEDATMAEEGDDDEYEPSSELLEALADLDDFASLLGDEPLESSPARARTPNPHLKHEPSQTPVRVKPEPMDEDHFLVQPPPRGPQASPSVRPAQARVKPEPMDEDHYLAQPPARGPQPSPSARPIPATVARVQVKSEPMDEDFVPPHSRESVRRNEGYKRYDRDDTRRRSPQHHGDRDDYRRSPSRHDYRPHLHSYGSPQARWRGNSDDRRSSDNNHRKRDRETRDERRWSNGEERNKRPRVKVEDTRD